MNGSKKYTKSAKVSAHPLNNSGLSFKGMENESKQSIKWKFEGKSMEQDSSTVSLREEKRSKCQRCEIF